MTYPDVTLLLLSAIEQVSHEVGVTHVAGNGQDMSLWHFCFDH